MISKSLLFRLLLLRSFSGSLSDFSFFMFLRISDNNGIGDVVVGSNFSFRVIRQHNFDFNSHNTLFEEDVSDGNINEISFRLTGRDHISLFEFHGFSSLLFKFSRNNDFTSFSSGSVFHNSFNDGVSGKSNGHLS